MSEMERTTFTSNSTIERSGLSRDSLMLMVSGTFGGGSLAVQKYSKANEDFVTVTTYTEATVTADELRLGEGRFRFVLSGATSPDLNIDYWSM